MNIYNIPLSKIYEQYSSSIQGLSTKQALKNKESFGENSFSSKKPPSLVSRFFSQFKNLMVLVLLFSSLISTIISLTTHPY
ncbi:MAG: hypothetical protein IJB98_00955, partial [Clostridia bacterium]|nr:hypothetical protein [Clostridia bacterium]